METIQVHHGSAAPTLPPGRAVDLPGRGRSFVLEHGTRGVQPTVMLLHGLGATAAFNWFASFPELERDFHVVAIDHRGHGRGIRSTEPFTLEDAADDVAALADVLGVGAFIAVGYSMGGPIAQLLWRRHPERVLGLVLCATAATFRARPHEHALFTSLPMFERVSTFLPASITEAIMSIASSPYRSECGYPEWARLELLRRDQRAVLQALGALGRFSARRWISDIDVPTSVIVHASDQLVPAERQRGLAWAIPGARLREIAADHFAPVRDPDPFNDALLGALDDIVDYTDFALPKAG
jgi:pimeloyl-ACP methyl ester carboxylesterase